MSEPREGWQARIQGALEAHFKQPDGPSRPGTDYSVEIKRADETHRLIVRAYLAANVTDATRRNTTYQAQTVIGYVFDRLSGGWVPGGDPLPPVTILDPRPGSDVPPPPKRGVVARLFGR